jgi:iron complex transport system permease protein
MAAATDARRRQRLGVSLVVATLVMAGAGLVAGSDGVSWTAFAQTWHSADAHLIIGEIRAPRTLGAWLTGALLGLAGAVAQGLFRNPLADPYLLGSASGASLGVVVVLASKILAGGAAGFAAAGVTARLGLVGAAFAGALLGVVLTLALARGAHRRHGCCWPASSSACLAAISDLITTAAPDALRGKQTFLLGTTGFLGWADCAVLLAGLAITLPPCLRLARALDALTLGDDTAASLGLPLAQVRVALVGAIALATGVAVSQAGLIAFVGLVAPHLVRRFAPGTHGFNLAASAAAGGAAARGRRPRSLIAPQSAVGADRDPGGAIVWR